MITTEQIYEADLRVEHIVDLDVMLACNVLSSDFLDWAERHEKALFEALDIDPKVLEEMRSEGMKLREIIEESLWKNPKKGWLIECSVPEMTPSADNESAMTNWGHTWVQVVRGATYEEALDAAMAWANERRAAMWPDH